MVLRTATKDENVTRGTYVIDSGGRDRDALFWRTFSPRTSVARMVLKHNKWSFG